MQNNNTEEDYEDNYSDIKIPNFSNEKEFNKELEEIMEVTKDIKIDWKKREAGIKRLGGIILSDWGKSEIFLKAFNQRIYLNLSIQLLDLRSSLMKEACRITILSVRRLRELIETAADKLMSPLVLFKLISSANKLISETGSQCVMEIIKNVESVKIINRIHEQMKNKSNIVRVRVCQQFLYVISYYNKNIWIKSTNILEEFIQHMTHDGIGDVRAAARKLFIKYVEMSPGNAKKLLSRFDNNVQKAINDEIDNDNESVTFNQIPKSKTMSNGKDYSTNFTNSTNDSLSTTTKLKNIVSTPSPIQIKNLNHTIANPSISIKKALEVSPEIKQNKVVKNYSKTESKNIVNKFNKMSIEEEDFITAHSNTSKKIGRDLDDYNRSNQEFKLNYNPTVNYNTYNNSKVSTNIENPIVNVDQPKFKSLEENLKQKINSILYDNDIASKLSQFENISNLFNEIYSNHEIISKIILKSLINVHIANLSETFPKLTIQVMKNLTKFIFYLDDLFLEENINKITKLILINISSDNEQISKNALSLFEIMKKKIDCNILIKPIIEIVDINTEITILHVCFELLVPIIEIAVEILSNQNYLNSFIFKLARILYETENNQIGDTKTIKLNFKENILDLLELIEKKYPLQFFNFFNENDVEFELKKFVINLLENDRKKLYDNLMKNNSNNNQNKIKSKSITNNNVKINFNNNSINKSKQSNINLEEEFPILNVNFEILSLVSSVKDFSTLINYFKSNLFQNLENFLLALIKIKYEQVLPILNQIQNILKSNEIKFPNDFMYLLINRIIFIFEKFGLEYKEEIIKIINLIPNRLDKEIYLQIISKYLSSRQSPQIVQILLISIQNVIPQINPENLFLILTSFIESIFDTLNHHISDVRKIGVFVIVDLYLILGQDFEVYLNELNPSQKNLINIYLKKKLENK